MSKRIMNEVMTLAEDEGLNIWYQDTDSMHINYEEVELLALAFNNKYNRDLIGEGMSQFYIDFGLDGACGEMNFTESCFSFCKSNGLKVPYHTFADCMTQVTC